jgi:DNA-binding MarR family transcriptional regulator
MHKNIQLSRDRESALHKLMGQLRVSQNATGFFDDAFASLLGINATDARCLDTVQRLGRVTAGELAATVGLSPSTITFAVDRLINAGYVERLSDKDDRRKVIMVPTALALELNDLVYAQIGTLGWSRLNALSDDELEIITSFLRLNSAIYESLIDVLHSTLVACSADTKEDRKLSIARTFAAKVMTEKHKFTARMQIRELDVGESVDSLPRREQF